ncbi:MAG: cobalt/nickel transport system permease protein [Acidimicrobiaceae bacterium]
MAAGHAGIAGLHHAGDSAVHRLPAEAKVAATVLFVFAVVATPRTAVWAFTADAALIAGVACLAHLPARYVLRRLRIELPFLAFAVFLPFVGPSPRSDLLGMSLSHSGLWAAWNIVAKGTLGVLAAIVLAATTPVAELLGGLERLHVPRVLVAITGFMVRYLDVIAGEAGRMRIARLSRGYDPRWIWQARGVAACAGSLFVRSYERGERVHLAMLSRGYTGAMPVLHDHRPARGSWAAAVLLPASAAAFAALAWTAA